MDPTQTTRRHWPLGSLCLVIATAALTLHSGPALAIVESSDSESSDSASDCPYLRLSLQSPHGTDEEYQAPLREMLSSSLSRAGFKVVGSDEAHYWWASSLALDDGLRAAWTTVVRAVPEIRGGGIEFTTAYEEVAGEDVPFHGMQSLRLFRRKDAPEAANRLAIGIARKLLPAAYQRCEEAVLAAQRKAERELESVRGELAEEMERVRRSREGNARMKGLQLAVDDASESDQPAAGRPSSSLE